MSWRRSLALAAVALLVACKAERSQAEPPRALGTLTFGLSTDTATIDPSITGSAITGLIARNVVDSLVGRPKTIASRPGSASAGKSAATTPAILSIFARG